MTNRNSIEKSVYLFFFCFLGGGILPVSKPVYCSPAAGRAGRPPTVSEMTAYENQKALEAYQKRNSKITRSADGVVASNQVNAALLYYQALLLMPEPNQLIDAKLTDIHRGIEKPDNEVRAFLGKCLPGIKIFQTASLMPRCMLGVLPENQMNLGSLTRKLFKLSFITLVDGQTLVTDGKYIVGLEQCLTVRRLARHLSEDPHLYGSALDFDRVALSTARDILGIIPPDSNTLVWFRNQLGEVAASRLSSSADMVKRAATSVLSEMQTDSDGLALWKEQAVQEAEGEQAKEDVRNLTSGEFLSRAREGLEQFTDSICRILYSEMSYVQKNAQVLTFIDESQKAATTDPVVKAFTPLVSSRIRLQWRAGLAHTVRVRGLRAAVEVYLVLAKTGRLPEELPEHLPKDPFTGLDFEYEITDEGFALRCQSGLTRREESRLRMRTALEFKVRK